MAGPAIPVIVLSGFLGAGKSTLLNGLLTDPAFADTAVVVNEFGEISIDHDLIRVGQRELMVTTTGCICCTAGSDIRASLFDLQETVRARFGRGFSRVIVETTGLADPAPIVNQLIPGGAAAQGLRDHVVARQFYLAGLVCAVDVIAVDDTLDQHFECLKQIAFADFIVLNKSDLSDPPGIAVDRLVQQLRTINPTATIVDRNAPGFDHRAVFAPRPFVPSRLSGDVEDWLALEQVLAAEQPAPAVKAATGRHGGRIRTFSVVRDEPVSLAEFELFLGLLRDAAGSKLLRLKGLVCLEGEPGRPVVVHAVQHSIHPLQQLDDWPSPDRRTRLVVIGDDIDPDAVRRLFDAFGKADQADRSGRKLALVVAVLMMLAGAALVTIALHVPASPHLSGSAAWLAARWRNSPPPPVCLSDSLPSRDPAQPCKART